MEILSRITGKETIREPQQIINRGTEVFRIAGLRIGEIRISSPRRRNAASTIIMIVIGRGLLLIGITIGITRELTREITIEITIEITTAGLITGVVREMLIGVGRRMIEGGRELSAPGAIAAMLVSGGSRGGEERLIDY
jgi:hypothetical protein